MYLFLLIYINGLDFFSLKNQSFLRWQKQLEKTLLNFSQELNMTSKQAPTSGYILQIHSF